MRLIVICLILLFTVPTFAAKNKNISKSKSPQKQQQVQAVESSLWNEKMCPHGIENIGNLLTIIPYNSEGRCFNYVGRLAQLLSKNQGLFAFMTGSVPFALIDFGNKSVPVQAFYGVVKGYGAFSYETISGYQKIVFSFKNIPKSKEREAWENKLAQIKAKEEETQHAEIQSNIEQENPLIYKDPSTGLIWARNGNIAEKKMNWKESMDWIKSLTYDGYSDWRLPTKDEFEQLLKIEGNMHSRLANNYITQWLNDNGFFNIQDAGYWTNSVYGDSNGVWYFDMTWGGIHTVNYNQCYILPVRGQ